METTDYDAQAQTFLTRFNLAFTMTHAQEKPSRWHDGSPDNTDCHWRVRLARVGDGRKCLIFDFWNSRHDTDLGKPLTAYSVLASLSSDVGMSADPDEIAAEFGSDMKPSQAYAIAAWGERLRKFFSDMEVLALQEIS